MLFPALRGFLREPPPMEMLSPTTGITVWRHKPRGSTTTRYEVRLYLYDAFWQGWETVTLPDTYTTEEEAVQRARSYLDHKHEQVWPKTVDTPRRKR